MSAEKSKSQVGESAANQNQTSSQAGESGGGRKRKRRGGDVVDEEGEEGKVEPGDAGVGVEQNLRLEIKRLRTELRRKDERLRELEGLMEQINRAAQVQRK